MIPRKSSPIPRRERPAEVFSLTEEERKLYENRCPQGYKKLKLLGKGGCAVVWLCEKEDSGEQVAVKQFPKNHHSY
jgi:serine/threonine protein kinase